MLSSTPGGDPPSGPIYISDSDDDLEIGDDDDDDDDDDEEEIGSAQKRRKLNKGSARLVISESESDDDVPISRLRSMSHLRRPVPETPVMSRSVEADNSRNFTPRRRLQKVGDIQDNKVSEKSENMNDTILEDEMEGDDSSSEGESLRDFIVEVSDVSYNSVSNCYDMFEHDGSLSGGCSDESESVSEGSMRLRYDELISSFGRGRKDKLKWEYESDMLADFGKSDELCMKAICVLYRQQTSEEKSYKATINRNGRGFSQFHASSGTALAEFLTDGDPHGGMNKTVEELLKFNSNGVEQCWKLANHYSKQLFEIYKNEEDPFFHP